MTTANNKGYSALDVNDDFDPQAPSRWAGLTKAEWKELAAAAAVVGKGLTTTVGAAGAIWHSAVSLQHHHAPPEHADHEVSEGSGTAFFGGAIALSIPIALGGLYDIYAGFARIRAVYAAHGREAEVDSVLHGTNTVYSDGSREFERVSR